MQKEKECIPDYIFETSWEVCNKVGGIYTVLSSRAKTLCEKFPNRVFFIGPDIRVSKENRWFIEDKKLYASWRDFAAEKDDLTLRVGYWDVPGKPIAILVDFNRFYAMRDEIYAQMWLDFGVDSMPSYGDYHEACMFAYAAGKTMESFYRFHHLALYHVVAHFNEWMMGMGALYIKKNVPKIATIFTTHATSIGRSIAGNNLPLYTPLAHYNGDEMAMRLNMVSKHSIEKKTAHHVDCFTTVSDITAKECTQLLQRQPDVVTVNGFDRELIPKAAAYKKKREKARSTLIRVTEKVVGHRIDKDATLIVISGRYEYKNKGIDVFVDAMNRLRHNKSLKKDTVAFIMVPAWMKEPIKELQERLSAITSREEKPLANPFLTHSLYEPHHDSILQQIQHLGFSNSKEEKLKIIFVPSYLNGSDGVFNQSYYDLLIGMDISVFPSYYEPWGYTPHESIAFGVPTITTTLAGFGLWARKCAQENDGFYSGVRVIERDDENSIAVAEDIAASVLHFSTKSDEEKAALRKAALRKAAMALSSQADWEHFIRYYEEAYRKALHSSFIRLSNPVVN